LCWECSKTTAEEGQTKLLGLQTEAVILKLYSAHNEIRTVASLIKTIKIIVIIIFLWGNLTYTKMIFYIQVTITGKTACAKSEVPLRMCTALLLAGALLLSPSSFVMNNMEKFHQITMTQA